MALVDMYLKIEGIDGEVTDSNHKNWTCALHSVRQGYKQTGKTGPGTTGAGAGRVAVEDIFFQAQTNKSSPNLFKGCASGQVYTKATIDFCKAGKGQQIFMQWEFTNVLVSSFRTALGFDHSSGNAGVEWSAEADVAGSEDWQLWDYFSLNVGTAKITYKTQDATSGALGAATSAGWNFMEGKEL